MPRKRWIRFAIEAVALWAFWLCLVGTLAWQEMVVGAASAAIASIAAETLRRNHVAQFRPRLTWFRSMGRIPWRLVADSAALFGQLVRVIVVRQPVRSRMTEIAFDPGRDDNRSAARRALAVLWITSTPSSIAVTVDRDRGIVLVHELPGTDTAALLPGPP